MVCLAGCSLTEVRSKTKAGIEYRHKGSNSTNAERYSVQQGLELAWSNGVKTGASYRRRDISNGSGDNDNGLWLDCSVPLWKAPKRTDDVKGRLEELEQEMDENEQLRLRVQRLEERLAALEAERTIKTETEGK
jgi:hypothetical protein